MRKLYLLKTFLLACLFSIVGGGMAWADGSDDFDESFKTEAISDYATRTSNAGWVCTNAQLVSIDGTIAPTINGKTTAVGTITSPTLSGGCGTLSFKYANTYSESKGVSVTVTIKDASGAEVFSQKVSSTTVDQSTVYTATIEGINVAGNFSIEIKNNSPSNNSKKNKDRVSIWNIQWTGYSAGGVILEPAGLSFGDPAPTVEADLYKPAEFTAPTLINPKRLAVTYGSSNEDVATVDAETGKVTLVGVGKTTITAKPKETTHYAGSASYTLNVIDTTPIAGLSGLRAKVTSTTAQQYTVNVTDAVVTYVNGQNAYLQTAEGAVLCYGKDALGLTKGQKINGPIVVNAKLYNGLLEVTAINTEGATVTTAEGELAPQVVTVAEIIANPTAYESRYVTIKDVQVTAAFNNRNATVKQGEDSYALRQNVVIDVPLVVNLNDIIDVTGFPSIFGEKLQFSVYEQDHIVTKAEEITLTIDEAGYATFYSDKALAIPAGIEATTVTAANNDGTLTMGWEYQAGDIVPAGTGILLRGEPNSYAAYQYANLPAAAPEANLLRGSVEAAMTEGGDKYYKLTYATVNDERILGFFWDAEGGVAFMNAAGKAYLALPAEMAAKGYRLDGSEVTGIGQIATDVQGEGQVYSISGVRMDGSKRLPAGIYIINGRKVIVK